MESQDYKEDVDKIGFSTHSKELVAYLNYVNSKVLLMEVSKIVTLYRIY